MSKTSICVDFSIVGERFDLAKVSEIMGIQPSETAFEKRICSEFGYGTQTSWSLRSEKHNTGDMSLVLRPFIQLLQSKKAEICKVNQLFSLGTVFIVEVDVGSDGYPATYLDRETIEFMHDIHAEIGFDVI